MLRRHATLAVLTLLTLLVHGYHPFAEDGGLYVAGIEYHLNPTLFPHDTAFVTAHLRYSIFAPCLAALARVSHLSLAWMLLLVYLLSVWTTLYAAWRIASLLFSSERAAFAATALLAAWFTLPVAGTSLLLMDPYVTARSLATPLGLLALAFMLEGKQRSRAEEPFAKPPVWKGTASAVPCKPRQQSGFSRWGTLGKLHQSLSKPYLSATVCILTAVAFHPLMATYTAAFLTALAIAWLLTRRTQVAALAAFAVCAISLAAILQAVSPAETAATRAADISRYYWFLSQWQWFELLGLLGPLIVLALLLHFAGRQNLLHVVAVCRAAIGLGLLAAFIAAVFAQQHFTSHAVARLQPLRAFLLLYVLMTLLLGGGLALRLERTLHRPSLHPFATAALALVLALPMYLAQRASFPASNHIELPWRALQNPWSRAFLWARNHTPSDALFALDANYITLPGEDAQTFRATAQRSVLADFSKDGGEAAITPTLSATWLAQSSTQKDLSSLNDAERDARLRPFGVTWMLLQSTARTHHPCPYDNGTVKLCSP